MKRLIALALRARFLAAPRTRLPLPLAVRETRKHPSNYGGVKQS